MLWYVIICILLLYPLLLVFLGHYIGRNAIKIALFFGCFTLWFFMAMRSVTVGVDTQNYAYVFQQFENIPFSRVFTAVTYGSAKENWVFDFEPGYRLLNKIVSFFCAAPQTITIVNSTIIILLLYRLIQKYSLNCFLSLWLYVTLGIFQTEMNVTRNAIAILIVYNCFDYIAQGKMAKYLLSCVVGSLFHTAALAFIPLYWIVRYYKPSFNKSLILVGVFVAIGLFSQVLSFFLKSFLPISLARYFIQGNEKISSLMVGIFNMALFMMIYLLLGKGKRENLFKEYKLGAVLLTINLCFFGLNISLDYAARMAALFGPYLIIFIPQMIDLFDSSAKRTKVSVLVAVLCGAQYILRMCVNNIGGTMPYSFFF